MGEGDNELDAELELEGNHHFSLLITQIGRNQNWLDKYSIG